MWSKWGGGDRDKEKESRKERETERDSGFDRKQWMDTDLSQVPSTCFEYVGGWGMPKRSSDTDADQGKGRNSKTPNIGIWYRGWVRGRGGVPVCACMHVRALRGCSSLALWLGEHPFSSLPVSLPHPGSPSFPPSLCFLSWSLCVSLAASAGCMLAQKAPPWGGVPMAAADASHTLIHSGVLPPPPLNPQEDSSTADSHGVVNGSPHPISPTKCGLQTHKWPALTPRRGNGWEPVSLKTPKTWPRKDHEASQARPG